MPTVGIAKIIKISTRYQGWEREFQNNGTKPQTVGSPDLSVFGKYQYHMFNYVTWMNDYPSISIEFQQFSFTFALITSFY